MSPHEGRPDLPVTPRLVLGLAIMMAGLVLALDSLGLLDASFVFRFWPLILVAVGVAKWQTPYQSSSAFVWIAAGIALLFMTVGHMPASRLWAAMLFFVGANIAWRALRPLTPSAGGDPASHVNMTAVLGGAKAVSHATEFRGGQALATLGGCEIDLRQASMPEGGEAVIDAFAFWGGVEIKVPEDWQVVNRGSAFLGGFEDKTRPVPGATKRLIVTGTAIMGGVEVKN
jgi:predicted membrane protein